MPKIIGLSGSLRQGSYNSALLRLVAELMPQDSELQIESIVDIPLYNGDHEASDGLPLAVRSLKEQIKSADGVLIATPEYNNSMPGVLKNAIDWLSRPATDIPQVFAGRPFAVIGATPGQGGTMLSQTAWLQVFRSLSVQAFFGGRLPISGAAKVFDEKGRLLDESVRPKAEKFIKEYLEFVKKERSL